MPTTGVLKNSKSAHLAEFWFGMESICTSRWKLEMVRKRKCPHRMICMTVVCLITCAYVSLSRAILHHICIASINALIRNQNRHLCLRTLILA